ncbi:zinc finger and BTB domain-containing protein 14-like [Sabethes cyaneus]|uniref:zinc finger and BTB domain-containing protein 14-like n=1 Tax=Sabethes cyaneus TaxID=53552 RepID=UPI00237E83C1|nr:zinc finger and BTB domain-containing protein 14-like [Sabethes cyaneus]
MTIYKLEKFPYVCRMCLKEPGKNEMFSLDTVDPFFDGSIRDFISTITFEIDENKELFLPREVCKQCLELLKFFAKFRYKLFTTHLFMDSLVELKLSNQDPIKNLFQTKSEKLAILFKDLDLCTKDVAQLDDLLDEFPNYRIAKMTPNEDIEKFDFDEDYFYAEECTTTELAELIIQSVETNPKPVVRRLNKANNECPVTVDAEDNDVELLDSSKCKDLVPTNTVRKYGGRRLAEPLQCPKCKYSTHYALNFQTHQLLHIKRENRRYACKQPGCPEVFLTNRQRNNHYGQFHKPLVCDTCGKQFPTPKALTMHKERHLNLMNHYCSFCGKGHNTKNDLRIHINNRHNATHFFSCETCGLQFKRKSVLNDHVIIHTNKKDFKCDKCDKEFMLLSALKKHCKTVHDKVRYACELCDESYCRRKKLKDHIEYVHGIQSRFVCDICLQMFDNQDLLDKHKARHANPKENECGVCLAVFPSAEAVENHLCITYRDDYICCERDFRYHYSYNKHMLLKHGVRTNARVKPDPNHLLGYIRAKRKRIETCPKCEKTFATRNQKKQHLEHCTGPGEVITDPKLESDDIIVEYI